MKKYLISIMALLALTSFVLLAADIDGKWTAETQGKNGPQTQTLTLKSSGNQLTGSMEGGRGGAVEISDGAIDGKNVSFKVVRDFGGKQNVQEFKGTLNSPNELKVTVTGGRGAQELTFKK